MGQDSRTRRALLGVVGGVVVASALVGSAGEGEAMRNAVIGAVGVWLGGGLAAWGGRGWHRYLAGALVGALVATAAFGLVSGFGEGGSWGLLLGGAIGNWAIIGGGSAAIYYGVTGR